jgi:GAF domain-containing protein
MESSDISETLEKILDYILDHLKRIDRGVIILIDNETGEISEVMSRLRKPADDTSMMFSRPVVDRVIREGKAVIISDVHREDVGELSDTLKLLKIGSVMCVPLFIRSKIRGVIYVDTMKTPYGFRKEDASLFTSLSGPAAIAIENALLLSREDSG